MSNNRYKYRESSLQYNVQSHGDTYRPESDFGLECPECGSFEISINNGGDSKRVYDLEDNEYVCKDCGCTFMVSETEELTDEGKRLNRMYNTITVICGVLVSISLIAGICFMLSPTLRVFGIILLISCFIFGVIGGIAENENNKL
jgi:transposase-like protein